MNYSKKYVVWPQMERMNLRGFVRTFFFIVSCLFSFNSFGQDVSLAGPGACNGTAISGSWVVPCGVTSITIDVYGGGGGAGGGGGGSNGGFFNTRGGGGGGGGGYTSITISVNPGSTFNYSVGAGGCGGGNGGDGDSGDNGTAGGGSSFSGTDAGGTAVNVTANGGARGTGGSGTEGSTGNGGAGGTATGGTSNLQGTNGSNGSGGNGGAGGNAPGPSGGLGGASSGQAGNNYGGGGAGGGNSNGGRGAAGGIFITYNSTNGLPPAPVVASTPATCSSPGSSSISAFNPLITYVFSPIGPFVGVGGIINGMTVGTSYTVYAIENGCNSQVSNPFSNDDIAAPPVAPTLTISPESCNAASTAAINNYSANYTYSFNPAGPSVIAGGIITNSTPGTNYTVTADAGGCTSPASLPFSVNAQLPVPTASISSAASGCSGSNTTLTASGGTGFVWADGGGNTIGITAAVTVANGTFTVTVTNASGCSDTETIMVTGPPALVVQIINLIPVSCNGLSDGQAEADATGGSPPYSFAWSNAENSQIATSLAAGTITVTVTDANGCTAAAQNNMTEPLPLSVSISGITPTLCNGSLDGGATATVIGGTAPYSYAWSNAETGSTATQLPAGSQSVIVTDANNCQANATPFTVTSPAELQATITIQTNISCTGQSDGVLIANANGGTAPFQYAWAGGEITQTISNVGAGGFSVTVTDQNACAASANFTLNDPAPLVVTTTLLSDISCFGADDGSATATVSGGNPPYSFLWNNSETTQTATSLPIGNASVVVADAGMCTATSAPISIAEPTALTASATVVSDVSCFGLNDGQLSGNAAGGTAPYQYQWISGPSSPTYNNAPAGNYTLTVSDANNCTANATATVIEPAMIDFTLSGTSTICIGQQITLTATPAFGQPPLVFTWDGSATGSTYDVSPTLSTDYTVTASDGTCISPAQTISVEVYPPLSLSVLGGPAICNGDTSFVEAIGSGGDGNLTYTWTPTLPASPGPHNVNPAQTNDYEVTLTDGCGSPPQTAQVTITVNPLPEITFSANDQNGCAPFLLELTNQSIITSGTIASYDWGIGSNASNAINPQLVLSDTGTYDVSLTAVSDQGCSASVNLTNYITVNAGPVASFYPDNDVIDIFNASVVMVNQSTNAVAYSWSVAGQNSNETNPVFNFSDSGTYVIVLTATSADGCEATSAATVRVDPAFALYVPNAFTPGGDFVNETFAVKGVGYDEFEMRIFNRWGMEVFRTKDPSIGWNGKLHGIGEFQKQDYYAYDIKLLRHNGVPYYYKGKVLLVK